MRIQLILGTCLVLVGCSAGVSGDIGTACMDAGRRDASPALCSCVQQVANQTLSRRDQSRAAAFFADPQLAQDTRQSDNPSSEAFWDRYRSFTDLAGEICQPVDVR